MVHIKSRLLQFGGHQNRISNTYISAETDDHFLTTVVRFLENIQNIHFTTLTKYVWLFQVYNIEYSIDVFMIK